MKNALCLIALCATAVSVPAAAQSMSQPLTGEELRGQTVDVRFADGTTNAVMFGATGNAQIRNAAGDVANGTWAVRDNSLCLMVSGATECWAYNNRFAAGQSVQLASSCDATSVWTARAVNPPRQEVMPVTGERG